MHAQAILSHEAASLPANILDTHARSMLRALMRDYLACTLAGGMQDASQKLRGALLRDANGQSRVYGTDMRSVAPLAAFANAHACHLLEFDDVHVRSIYHPGAPVFSAVLAVADRDGIEAADFVAGVVAGYEVGIRLGEAAGTSHYARHHTTGTVGCIGAAAGVARALGLDAAGTSSAIGHAATQAAALWAFREDNAEAKPVHAGHAAMIGVISADMARAGLRGSSRAIDGDLGFLNILGGNRSAPVLTEQFSRGNLRMPRVSIKRYPCCGHTHSGIEAALDLTQQLGESGIDTSEIEQITIETYGSAVAVAGVNDPQTPEQACFSYPHIVAATMTVGPDEAISEAALSEPRVQDLARKIRLVHNEGVDAQYPQRQPVTIEALTFGGGRFLAEACFGAGSPELPLTEAQHETKLRRLAGRDFGSIDEIVRGVLSAFEVAP
ncbi:MmgE/PrpD family protein [Pararhizobium haloflavum]|uniref:MmgE/PrpD family protein n=1 Tax=Pararhizobium haloflavum TaxID=2037914 RepID=UPI000C1877E1|nr:MmgE/PrpD family protein [Pararhizobium haloflavum]